MQKKNISGHGNNRSSPWAECAILLYRNIQSHAGEISSCLPFSIFFFCIVPYCIALKSKISNIWSFFCDFLKLFLSQTFLIISISEPIFIAFGIPMIVIYILILVRESEDQRSIHLPSEILHLLCASTAEIIIGQSIAHLFALWRDNSG